MFADDIKIFHSFNSISDMVGLQPDLNNLSKWCKANGMLWNPKRNLISYSFHGLLLHSIITTLDSYKLDNQIRYNKLGVILDSKLYISNHASKKPNRVWTL